jgi:predicted kinase
MMIKRAAKPMIDQTLLLLSGLPGCGKSTLARQLALALSIPLFAKDRFQSLLRRRGLAGRATADGYYLLLDMADEQLGLGVSVILDAVFPQEGFRQEATRLAERHGARMRPIYCFCSDEATWRQRLAHRNPNATPHWSPVGWDEVERLRALFVPWPPGQALAIDCMADAANNVQRVLACL